MRGRAGSVPEISVSGLEILPYEHFSPVTGMNGGMNSSGSDDIVLYCLLYFTHHKHSHLTAVIQLYLKIGPKVKIFVFRNCVSLYLLCFPNLAPGLVPSIFDLFLISETGLKFLISNQGIHPGNQASPVNRAHMKRPLNSRPQLMSCKSENRLAV